MITAQQARDIVNNEMEKRLYNISKEIEQLSKEGKSSITFHYALMTAEESQFLKNNGYKITIENDKTTISW